ncbi:MAG: lipoprotein-releasing ABC transporter permease subunit [Pseudomonadota bacterium]|nr:lipoprotein-releasing ABC transporter permease subunit [Gammaproteobacteria bacterium]MBU1558924.1 lipoprotein-releasing ABC transporter permease subunit [Gammaproteobacteria bacterium]MBU1629285.1 lipoprotein-releasing ABC transporter permease subunit [Gammaproteobacteria bacterium]MBU1926555.1 lipoprotein-releasing ABC transporter permease subunit [Gammaproteobacteria bacterium]MBU2546309.1 lipoprotein-releasing ABC transporter permease subunit [Gammaproteobacteria bacterium]
MFRPLALFIGLRYTRAKRRNRFISFISLVSVLGIALGVLVLITVLSVMNGFDQQIRNKIFDFIPHITVTGMDHRVSDWPSLSRRVTQMKGVLAAAPYVMGQGLLSKDQSVHPVIVKGIEPAIETQVTALAHQMKEGKLSSLKSGRFEIVLGQNLANDLGAFVGDYVTLIIPQVTVSPVGMLPRFKRFKVIGIFSVGPGFGFDNNYAFIQIHDAQKLYGLGNTVSGVQLKIKDLFAADNLSLSIEKQLKFKYETANWTDQFGPFYHAVQMEKSMMFFILLLLVAIAAFNLVSSLVMLVNDKRADIAILKTLGATPKMIMSVFIVQGFFIGMLGTLLGVIGGVLLSLNVTRLVNFIQDQFHVQLFTPGVYWVNYLPSQLLWSDVLHISIAAILMSLLATIYPAWRAGRVLPVEALRYE